MPIPVGTAGFGKWKPTLAFAAGAVIGALGGLMAQRLIPTLVLLFGCDVKLAGSLSLAVSLPTMLMGFARYSRHSSFAVLGRNKGLVFVMAAGSVAGSFIGARLLGVAEYCAAAATCDDLADQCD